MTENPEKLLVELNNLIDKGIALTHLHPKRDLEGNRKTGAVAAEAYSNYIEWNYTCCPLLNKNGFKSEAEKFTEGDSLGIIHGKPIFKDDKPTFEKAGGHRYKRPYSDATPEDAQKLLEDIREEVKKKLEILRSVRDKIAEWKNNVKLADYEITFDNKKGTIFIGKLPCELPPHQHEHCLARIMFGTKPNVHVEWVDIAKEITGNDFERLNQKKDPRMVKDTAYRTNDRIKQEVNTKDELYSWENKGVIRNY